MVRSRSTAKQATTFAVAAQSGGGNGSGGEQQPWSRPGPLRCSCYCFALAELGQQRYNQHGPAHLPPSRLPQPSKLAVPLQLRTLGRVCKHEASRLSASSCHACWPFHRPRAHEPSATLL